jgi:RNA polymerase sigma-70 factor (ECF subfamily)
MDLALEARLAELRTQGQFDQLATTALETYGPELYGFMQHVTGDPIAASEVFSQTIEDFWRGLPAFQGRCAVRTWLYVLTHSAISRYRRSPWNRVRTGDSALEDMIAVAHSRTSPWQRTDIKDKWRELRDSLDPDDRALLVLRIDRDLDWVEVSRVMLADADAETDSLERESARLRKRFQKLKEELRERARQAGLVGGE